ncbi:Intermediate filament tail domain protein [Marinomonas spartinae]|uniref:lamin tail domain-containing protein n=1 Tax=Marinomonas spartinae TaxID=1792290 RepID=UPI000808A30C|nr:lamin tail domain-containing protein [Marinomonas spartinae]SBS31041.1 Intermediate filament tail domain protein [Marinomonas spartinae]
MSFFNKQLHKEINELLSSFASCSPLTRQKANEYWQQLNRIQALSQVQIENIDFKGNPTPLDESITIRNLGGLIIDISDWRIQAGSPKQVYIFPEGSVILPNDSICIDTSGNTEHSFNTNRPIWNNRGDTGTLFDDEGQIISTLSYGDNASRKTLISHMNYDGQEFRNEGDEFVEISNLSNDDVMLSGWRLEALTNNHIFHFPEGTKLEAYTSLKVYTNKADLQRNEYSFNSPTAIWNNARGGCKLINYRDDEVSIYHY